MTPLREAIRARVLDALAAGAVTHFTDEEITACAAAKIIALLPQTEKENTMLLKVTTIHGRAHAIPLEQVLMIGKPNLQEMAEGAGNCVVTTNVGMIACNDKYDDVCEQYTRLKVRN